MKVHTDYLWFETKKRREMVHITPQIEAIVAKSEIEDGLKPGSSTEIRLRR
jgi:thiamine phosphate synthase YjbQ (UPF0047 family)